MREDVPLTEGEKVACRLNEVRHRGHHDYTADSCGDVRGAGSRAMVCGFGTELCGQGKQLGGRQFGNVKDCKLAAREKAGSSRRLGRCDTGTGVANRGVLRVASTPLRSLEVSPTWEAHHACLQDTDSPD